MRISILVLLAIIALSIISGIARSETIPEPVQFQQTTNVKRFFQQCTGMPITSPEVETMAYLSCMARVRGMSDGHALTSQIFAIKRGQLYQRGIVVPDMKLQVWCIDNSKSDGEVFQSVINWINKNEELVNRLNTQYTNPNQVGIGIIITSLRETYPCQKGIVG